MILPDATILLDYMQHLATGLVEGMTVHPDRMRANLELTHGALFSQRALTALIESGMTRDDAYRLVQEAAQEAWDRGPRSATCSARRSPRAATAPDAERRSWRPLTSTRSSTPSLPRARARGDRAARRGSAEPIRRSAPASPGPARG